MLAVEQRGLRISKGVVIWNICLCTKHFSAQGSMIGQQMWPPFASGVGGRVVKLKCSGQLPSLTPV